VRLLALEQRTEELLQSYVASSSPAAAEGRNVGSAEAAEVSDYARMLKATEVGPSSSEPRLPSDLHGFCGLEGQFE
jgi:hypothetical protein